MLEVEAKYRLADPTAVEARLTEWGATRIADTRRSRPLPQRPRPRLRPHRRGVPPAPHRRREPADYKGPRHDATSKTRTEIEVPCPSGRRGRRSVLETLPPPRVSSDGRGSQAPVDLQWARDGFTVHACLDDVENVGRFVELEIVAPDEQLATSPRSRLAHGRDLASRNTETGRTWNSCLARHRPAGRGPREPHDGRMLPPIADYRRRTPESAVAAALARPAGGSASCRRWGRCTPGTRPDSGVAGRVPTSSSSPSSSIRPSSARTRTTHATRGPSTRIASCAAQVGTDLIFAPTPEEMYPPDSRTIVEVTRPAGRLVRRVAAGPLPRRRDGGAEAVQHRSAGRRVLRPEGRPAGADHPADGRRPERAGDGPRPSRRSAKPTGWQ